MQIQHERKGKKAGRERKMKGWQGGGGKRKEEEEEGGEEKEEE